MKARRPPALATWLLDRLGYTRLNLPLAGDLLEEFHAGRSSAWYWRQTVMVIANGAVRNGARQRRHLAAFLAGVALQLPLVYVLWEAHYPEPAHGFLRVASAVAMTLLATASRITAKRSVHGSAFVAFDSFSSYLFLYCLCCWVWRMSLANLAGAEIFWVVWDLAWMVLRIPGDDKAAPAATTPLPDPTSYPPPELVLPVASGDATVELRPETLAESVFATADEDLASALFRNGASLEAARRAIWLGSARRYLERLRDPAAAPAATVPELSSLMDEASRKDGQASRTLGGPARK